MSSSPVTSQICLTFESLVVNVIFLTRTKSSKFSPKVDEGFMFGYGSNAYAYHVFNKTFGIVEFARDVQFDETNGSQVDQVDTNNLGDELIPSEAIKNSPSCVPCLALTLV